MCKRQRNLYFSLLFKYFCYLINKIRLTLVVSSRTVSKLNMKSALVLASVRMLCWVGLAGLPEFFFLRKDVLVRVSCNVKLL